MDTTRQDHGLPAPDPVEYEDLPREQKIAWQISEAEGWHGDANKAAHNLASQLVDAEAQIDELVAALIGMVREEWRDDDDPILVRARTAARAALASAGVKA